MLRNNKNKTQIPDNNHHAQDVDVPCDEQNKITQQNKKKRLLQTTGLDQANGKLILICDSLAKKFVEIFFSSSKSFILPYDSLGNNIAVGGEGKFQRFPKSD